MARQKHLPSLAQTFAVGAKVPNPSQAHRLPHVEAVAAQASRLSGKVPSPSSRYAAIVTEAAKSSAILA